MRNERGIHRHIAEHRQLAAAGVLSPTAWGSIIGDINNQEDLLFLIASVSAGWTSIIDIEHPSGVLELDLSLPCNFNIQLNGNVTDITVSGFPASKSGRFYILFTQDLIGNRSIAWPIAFVGATAPGINPLDATLYDCIAHSNGKIYVLSKTVYRAGDPYYSSVSLLAHFNGADGATTFLDSGPNAHAFTMSGDGRISTEQFRFGGSSYKPNTSGILTRAAGVNAPFQLSNVPFTLEASFYLTSLGSARCIIALWGGSALSWYLGLNPSNKPVFYYSQSSAYEGELSSPYAISANAWHSVAVRRRTDTNVLELFVNDTLVHSIAFTKTFYNNTTMPVSIGTDGTGIQRFAGYLDAIRLTKEVARPSIITSSEFPDFAV